jgi:hypothetical protein
MGTERAVGPKNDFCPYGAVLVARSNVYNKVVPFVAFTKLDGEEIKGTHNGAR